MEREHSGSGQSPLGYDGQYTEADTGLVYLRARPYEPATAQFLSVDPLVGFTREPYGYASADPLNELDPSGLCGFSSLSDFGDCFNPVSSGNLAYKGAVNLSNQTGGIINLPWLGVDLHDLAEGPLVPALPVCGEIEKKPT